MDSATTKYFFDIYMLLVNAASPRLHDSCPCLYSTCPCWCASCLSMLYVQAACPSCMSMQPVHATCLCFIYMQKVHTACLYCMTCGMSKLYCHVAFPCCTHTCPCCLSMLHVLAVCPCVFPFCISMLHVLATTHATCPCCMPFFMPMSTMLPVQVAKVKVHNYCIPITFLVRPSTTDLYVRKIAEVPTTVAYEHLWLFVFAKLKGSAKCCVLSPNKLCLFSRQ